MGMALNINFPWIFVDFGSVLGRLRSALEPSWESWRRRGPSWVRLGLSETCLGTILKTWTNGRKARQIYFSDLFFIGLGSPRAMAGTYRGVLACSAGPLRHGILDTFFNWKEKANYATFFPELLSKLEALLEIIFLKKLWKLQLHVIC